MSLCLVQNEPPPFFFSAALSFQLNVLQTNESQNSPEGHQQSNAFYDLQLNHTPPYSSSSTM